MLLCGFPDRPDYGACPPVRLSRTVRISNSKAQKHKFYQILCKRCFLPLIVAKFTPEICRVDGVVHHLLNFRIYFLPVAYRHHAGFAYIFFKSPSFYK